VLLALPGLPSGQVVLGLKPSRLVPLASPAVIALSIMLRALPVGQCILSHHATHQVPTAVPTTCVVASNALGLLLRVCCQTQETALPTGSFSDCHEAVVEAVTSCSSSVSKGNPRL
jgi:hypothetical protein